MNPSNYPNDFNKMVGKPYSYHEHIINKPEKATIQKRRRNIVVVDSRFRDKTKYPNPSDYTIEFDEHYKYVTEVEMISYCIPRDAIYQITAENKNININEDSGNNINININITLDEDIYNIDELSDAISSKIPPINNYSVSYSTTNKTITITQNNSKDFKITNAPLFGINQETAQKNSHTFYLNKCPYVMLKINPLKRYDSIDGNSAIRDSFALIPLGNDFKELLTTHNYGNVKYFNPPLPKLSQFKVKFLNPLTKTTWDFRNRDHVMIFVITTLNQSGIYSDTLQ